MKNVNRLFFLLILLKIFIFMQKINEFNSSFVYELYK